MRPRTPVRASERGFALLPVLWTVALLAVIAGAVAVAMRGDAGVARAQRLAAEGRAIADGAINLAIAQLLATDPAARPRLDGTPFALDVAGETVRLQVQDETGKIDLNIADPALLRRYVAVSLEEPEPAAALADAVLARRLPGGRPFLSVAELGLLPGMTPERLARLAPGVTVHAQAPGPDPLTAVPAALLALPRMTPAEVERLLALRLAAEAAAARPAREILGVAVEIRAALDLGGLRVARRAVVRLVADRQRPVWIYAWE